MAAPAASLPLLRGTIPVPVAAGPRRAGRKTRVGAGRWVGVWSATGGRRVGSTERTTSARCSPRVVANAAAPSSQMPGVNAASTAVKRTAAQALQDAESVEEVGAYSRFH